MFIGDTLSVNLWQTFDKAVIIFKKPSKNRLCYLVKFLTAVLYILILFIFLKKLRFLHPNEAHGSES